MERVLARLVLGKYAVQRVDMKCMLRFAADPKRWMKH